MKSSKIEWTNWTWNPVTGCSEISEGCRNCYARSMARRLQAMGTEGYQGGFEVALQPARLHQPLQKKKGKMIFVSSMGDLFHEKVPFEYIDRVFEVMHAATWHTFQILTKRSQRLVEYSRGKHWPVNVWVGVTVESNNHCRRIDELREVEAHTRYLSMEPLLGPVPGLDLSGISWVIVGGESGPGARLMQESWIQEIKARCNLERVPFFFKQWGGKGKKGGCELSGKTYKAFPASKQQDESR